MSTIPYLHHRNPHQYPNIARHMPNQITILRLHLQNISSVFRYFPNYIGPKVYEHPVNATYLYIWKFPKFWHNNASHEII